MMELGAGLGWTPAAFWSATIPELLAFRQTLTRMSGDGRRAASPPDRAELRALMARFPDGPAGR